MKNSSLISIDSRIEKLKKVEKFIRAKETLIYQALKDDLGKSEFESYLTEVGFILDELKFTLKNLKKWARPQKVTTPFSLIPGKSYLIPEPFGEILVIAPWNYPFQLCFSPLIGAIAAGNRVVLKPSEFTPATTKVIKEIISEIFNSDEVTVIEGGVAETQELLKRKFDYIFFTGSTAVGKVVMKAAAEHLTPVTLELGGKSPCLIEESANLELAAKRIIWGKFLNAGQTCVAPDYVLVPAKLQDPLVEKMKEQLTIFFGDAKKSEDYPRIINEKHIERLKSYLVNEKIASGGRSERESRFFEPTIMRDVSWNDRIMEEEIFGPILPLIPYENYQDTMIKLSSMPKPLAFYVFSEDSSKGFEAMEKLSFGGGCINDTLLHLGNPHLSFGGVGPSGIGSYHGKKSFETFSHYKSVFKQTTWFDIPLRYPPFKGKFRWLKLFLG